ncbi:response regulator transcription factor [Tissierellaceae bacterium HCP3S3_D8]
MKILIVDDEKDILNLISKNLILEGYEAVVASTGREAILKLKKENPDIVLLDIMLPDSVGYDVLKEIHEYNSAIPVIFISALDKRSSKILGLELGADDYITKPFDSKELVSRVKALWRRMNYVKQEAEDYQRKALRFGNMEIDPTFNRVSIDDEIIELTFKEFNTLHFLASHYGQVISRETLINKIWGYDYVGNTRAVDVLIRRLRSKIEPYDKFIISVYGAGYKFQEE